MGFFGSFSGSTQRKDIRNANSQATAALDKGYAQSQDYYNQAVDMFSPYAQQGGQANAFYSDALGLNGAGARDTAQETITSDPLWQGKLAEDQNAMLKYLNARGEAGGGKAYLAGQRILAQNYGDVLNRYRDAGQQGFQATGAQSTLRAGQGDNAFGFGATKAGQAINYGNALAETRGIGVNNLLKAVGTGIGGYNAMFRKGA